MTIIIILNDTAPSAHLPLWEYKLPETGITVYLIYDFSQVDTWQDMFVECSECHVYL